MSCKAMAHKQVRNLFLYTCWKSCTTMFEAATIDIMDGTQSIFAARFGGNGKD